MSQKNQKNSEKDITEDWSQNTPAEALDEQMQTPSRFGLLGRVRQAIAATLNLSSSKPKSTVVKEQLNQSFSSIMEESGEGSSESSASPEASPKEKSSAKTTKKTVSKKATSKKANESADQADEVEKGSSKPPPKRKSAKSTAEVVESKESEESEASEESEQQLRRSSRPRKPVQRLGQDEPTQTEKRGRSPPSGKQKRQRTVSSSNERPPKKVKGPKPAGTVNIDGELRNYTTERERKHLEKIKSATDAALAYVEQIENRRRESGIEASLVENRPKQHLNLKNRKTSRRIQQNIIENLNRTLAAAELDKTVLFPNYLEVPSPPRPRSPSPLRYDDFEPAPRRHVSPIRIQALSNHEIQQRSRRPVDIEPTQFHRSFVRPIEEVHTSTHKRRFSDFYDPDVAPDPTDLEGYRPQTPEPVRMPLSPRGSAKAQRNVDTQFWTDDKTYKLQKGLILFCCYRDKDHATQNFYPEAFGVRPNAVFLKDKRRNIFSRLLIERGEAATPENLVPWIFSPMYASANGIWEDFVRRYPDWRERAMKECIRQRYSMLKSWGLREIELDQYLKYNKSKDMDWLALEGEMVRNHELDEFATQRK